MLSILPYAAANGSLYALTMSGRTLEFKINSKTDASPINFIASAFFSIASASALPLAKIPAASCSAANLSASAFALNASAS
jgi:hypothetical protein